MGYLLLLLFALASAQFNILDYADNASNVYASSAPFYPNVAFGWGAGRFLYQREAVLLSQREGARALCENTVSATVPGAAGKVLIQVRGVDFSLIPGFLDPFKEGNGLNCALERRIASCREANAAGFVEVFIGDPTKTVGIDTEWWACRNCSFFSGQPVAFPVGIVWFTEEEVRASVISCSATGSNCAPSAFYNFSLGNVSSPPPFPILLQETALSRFAAIRHPYGLILQILMATWLFYLIVTAAFWIAAQIKVARSSGAKFPTLAIVALSLETLSCLIRWVYVVVDPYYMWSIYPVYFQYFMVNGFDAFSLMATVTIAVFWIQASGLVKRVSIWRGRSLVLLLLCYLICFLAVFLPAIMRVFVPQSQFQLVLLISAVTAGVLHLLLAIFFVASGIFLQHQLNRGAQLQRKKKMGAVQKKMLIFLLFDSFFMTALAATFFMVISPFFLSGEGWFTTWTLVWFFQLAVSTCQIWVFSITGYLLPQDKSQTSTTKFTTVDDTASSVPTQLSEKSAPKEEKYVPAEFLDDDELVDL